MTDKKTELKILEAIKLAQDIAELETIFEGIKAELRAEAEKYLRQDPAFKELAGTQFSFCTAAGPVARVSFPSPGLVRQIVFLKEVAHRYREVGTKKVLVPLGGDLRKLCGDGFSKLFAISYKPAKAFNELLGALLPKASAAKVLEICQEPPGQGRVSFEVKENPKTAAA